MPNQSSSTHVFDALKDWNQSCYHCAHNARDPVRHTRASLQCVLGSLEIPPARQPRSPGPRLKLLKVTDVRPNMSGANIYVKILKQHHALDDSGLSEVVAGDVAAMITIRFRGMRPPLCDVGQVVTIHNAQVVMPKGFMRLKMDRRTSLTPTDSQAVYTANDTAYVSAAEYEKLLEMLEAIGQPPVLAHKASLCAKVHTCTHDNSQCVSPTIRSSRSWK